MPIIAQHRWRWCGQCQCLWYSGATANPNGRCVGTNPPGGPHSQAGSSDYALFGGQAPAFKATLMGQENWRWCAHCGGLWHPSSALPSGACPGTHPPGGPHTSAGSGEYALLNDTSGTMG
jgi:hypothetical protein